MLVNEVDKIIADTFENFNLKTYDKVFEKSEDGYKYVISLHELQSSDEVIIHTKFIFYTDDNKENIVGEHFMYLYDLNCIYKRVKIPTDLGAKLKEIVETNEFGDDIVNLSKFITDTPIRKVNSNMAKSNIKNITLYNMYYNPQYKITPCENTSFSFDLNINGTYELKLIIKKEVSGKFILTYNVLSNSFEYEVNSIDDLDKIISNNLIHIFNNKL